MNKDVIMGATTSTSSDLQLCPASPDAQEIYRRSLDTSDISAGNIRPITTIRPHQHNPRKKRTRMIRLHNSKPIVGVGTSSQSGLIAKKKPDPSAPKITRPCTECGKRFWSWKALFGHMRCHPERPWRGINPPPNLPHPPLGQSQEDLSHVTTEEDEYVAACLLMLANGPSLSESIHAITAAATTNAIATHTSTSYQHHDQSGLRNTLEIQMGDLESRFECSSCKKVFGSHQALGGHRASHKNVKGCFAIRRNNEEVEEGELVGFCDRNGGGGDNMVMVLGSSQHQQQHRCSICLRIFSSGQALGGHKRCHWEKDDGVVQTASASILSQGHMPFRFDLNLPAPIEEDDSTCSSSDLDLRLGL